MKFKQHLYTLLAASSLAAVASGCGGANVVEDTDPEEHVTSGDEAENTCGGGACGSVTAKQTEPSS
jgi:hypothetical protein